MSLIRGMAPNTMTKECIETEDQKSKTSQSVSTNEVQYVWRNVILMTVLHMFAIYGIYIALFRAKVNTLAFVHIIAILSSMGVQVCQQFLYSMNSILIEQPFISLDSRVHTDYGRTGHTKLNCRCVSYQPSSISWPFRTTYTSGVATIGCTTSIRKQMPIPTTRGEASSSRTWAGFWSKSIRTSERRARISI